MSRTVLYIPSGFARSRNFSFDTGLTYYGLPIQSWGDAKLLSKFIKKQETAYNRHPEKFTGESYDRIRLMSEAAKYLDTKNNSSVYSAILNRMTGPAPVQPVPETVSEPNPPVPVAKSTQPAQMLQPPDPEPIRPGVNNGMPIYADVMERNGSFAAPVPAQKPSQAGDLNPAYPVFRYPRPAFNSTGWF